MEKLSRGAGVKVILFKSKKLSNGEYPLMLRISKSCVRKYISLGINCAESLWDENKGQPKLKHPNKNEIINKIQLIEREFLEKIEAFKLQRINYTIEDLTNSVVKKVNSNLLFEFIDELIITTKSENRLKTAEIFLDCKHFLFKYTQNKNLSFKQIDYNFLLKMESYMRQQNLKETTMSVYFRTLRSIYNKAIMANIVEKSLYPFDTFKITKFNTKTRKRAISKEDILKIINYPVHSGSKMQDCLNIFKFSYLNQGMNYVDIAYLKWKDINSQGVMEYTRRKTGKDFAIRLDENSVQVLEQYKLTSGYSKENFIFPILDSKSHTTPEKVRNRLKKVLKQLNLKLKFAAKELKIDSNITSYVARHTYATVLKKSGVSTAIISEALGHESESITNVYLDEFDSAVIFEANKNLV